MKRILVVDDQEDIRELVRMTLELDGYEVHEAENGDLGLQAVSRLQPDLMLLDVMMPGSLDGLGVCRAVRRAPPSRKLRIVMLSAKGQKADQQAGLDAGADAYLAKPFSPRELLQVVSRMA
jgi:DNA-binding response OmpR family regulator